MRYGKFETYPRFRNRDGSVREPDVTAGWKAAAVLGSVLVLMVVVIVAQILTGNAQEAEYLALEAENAETLDQWAEAVVERAQLTQRLNEATGTIEAQERQIRSLDATITALTKKLDAAEKKLAAKPKPAPKVQAATSDGTGWSSAKVSWYGPGFYGRKTASGAVLTQGMRNVAHKTLPFGTRIEFVYKGASVIAVVNDRGPFVAGRTFDLGPGTAKALGFSGVGTVKWRVL